MINLGERSLYKNLVALSCNFLSRLPRRGNLRYPLTSDTFVAQARNHFKTRGKAAAASKQHSSEVRPSNQTIGLGKSVE